MNPFIIELKTHIDKTVQFLKDELKQIRTGKANPGMIENLVVETYGGSTRLRLLEVASIVTDGPATLAVAPFDPSTTGDIEKAILKSPLGIAPSVQGARILIKLPPLSEEQREKMIKLVAQQIEERKQIVRNLRDDARKKTKSNLENKTITEDDKFRLEKEFDTLTQKYMEEIEKIRTAKEAEIREV